MVFSGIVPIVEMRFFKIVFSLSSNSIIKRKPWIIGNRAGLFHHMAEDHNFNVGQPDNIVFSNEFLDTLQSKLDNSICLYCEKDFKSVLLKAFAFT